MSHLHEPFLALVAPGGHILDAGCGSGRDMAAFAGRGFRVSGFDGSIEMSRRAAERTGVPVRHLAFDQVDWDGEFDGVWACVSLAHLPSSQLAGALARLGRALRPGGVVYASFREGSAEGIHEERWFNCEKADGLRRIIAGIPALQFLRTWTTGDVRPERHDLPWINLLAQRA